MIFQYFMCCTQGPITPMLKFWDVAVMVGNSVDEPVVHHAQIDGTDHAFSFGNV